MAMRMTDNGLPVLSGGSGDGYSGLSIISRSNVRMVERLADQQRQQAMREAWTAYEGLLPDPLKVQGDEPNLNVKANRIAPIVDTGNFWLFGDPLGIEVDPDQELLGGGEAQETDDANADTLGLLDDDADDAAADAAADASADGDTSAAPSGAPDEEDDGEEDAPNPNVVAAQDYLDGCWGDEDERMLLLAEHFMNGAVCGHAFWKILPPDAKSGRQYPRLVELDPQTVTMRTDPEDCKTVNAYVITYDTESEMGAAITKRQVIARVQAGADGPEGDYWSITNYVRASSSDWMPTGTPQKHPWPWPPIVDHPHFPMPNQRWGRPAITPDLIQLNKATNFVKTNINAIGYSHGHPWLWASGMNVQLLKTAPGMVTGIPNADGRMGAIEAHGDIPGLMAYEADLRADMDEQSKVPAVAAGRMAELPKGQMSGVAIRMLYMPLIFQNTFLRRTYGKAIREASARMLALGGYGDGTDLGGVKTTLHWSDPLPVDDLQEAQAAVLWQQIGVSPDTLMERSKAGFDPEVERRKNELADSKHMSVGEAVMQHFNAGGPQGASNPYGAPGQPGQQPPAQQPMSAPQGAPVAMAGA